MNERELQEFLDRPLAATVATTNAGGTPHAVPIWYRYDGASFTIWTDASRRWVRNAASRSITSD